jgi:CheY-like chemotaxis protein
VGLVNESKVASEGGDPEVGGAGASAPHDAQAAPQDVVGDDAASTSPEPTSSYSAYSAISGPTAPAPAPSSVLPSLPSAIATPKLDARPRTPSLVLVIDPDAVSRRFAEIALGRKGDLAVMTAVDAAGAVEILASTRVHLVVSETELADSSGLQLLRRLGQEGRLHGVPFVFLSADSRPPTRSAAFAAGADDFLIKPCDGEVLGTRARSLIARERRMIAERRPQLVGLAGRFSELACQDLLALLEHGQRSGTVSVICEEAMGTLFVDSGQVVHAVFGSLLGPAALAEVVKREDGQFEFAPQACPIAPARRNITITTTWLAPPDTRNVTAKYFAPSIEEPSPTAAAVVPRAVQTVSPLFLAPASTPGLIPPFIPDAGSATQIDQAVSDGFTLGDLMSFDEAELAEWTASAPVRERFHVVLAADLAQGVSSMLALAGSPAEEWVLRSLKRRTSALALSFVLRRARIVDVVLIDIRHPAQVRDSLRRVPSAIIVAPPGGDPTALGVKAQVEIVEFVARMTPPAVLVLGHPTLKKAFRRPGGEAAIRCLPAALGEPTADLRIALAEAVRLCASATH